MLHEWLGATTFGDVFRTSLADGTPAALLLAAADDDDYATSLLHNWQTAAALNHPHLLHVFEASRALVDDFPVVYIVAELPDEALSQILPERALGPAEVRQMLAPVLDALAYLHAQDLVHGSIEPASILVVGDQVKLAPYSLQPAGSFPARAERARIYDAPETDYGTLTPDSDLWSVGILLTEALTQHTPTWVRASGRDPAIPAIVPEPFAEIARRSLRFEPAQRCTLAEMWGLLSNPVAVPAMGPTATPTAVAVTEQLPLFEEPALENEQGAPAEEPRLRKSFRSIEEEDELPRLRWPERLRLPVRLPLPVPVPYLLGAAALLFLLVVGLVAYSHHGKKTLAPAAEQASEQSSTAPTARAEKAIKPLPQPSGPTVKGTVAQRVIPEIPARAARGIHGRVEVKIKLTVDHSGNVINAAIVSDGRSRYFANQALAAGRKWRFRPAKIHGQPAASTWDLRFTFKPSGTDVTPTEVTP